MSGPVPTFYTAHDAIIANTLTARDIPYETHQWSGLLAVAFERDYYDAIPILVTRWTNNTFTNEIPAFLRLMRARAQFATGERMHRMIAKIDQSLRLILGDGCAHSARRRRTHAPHDRRD